MSFLMIIHLCRGGRGSDHVVQHGEAAEGGRGGHGAKGAWREQRAGEDPGQGGEQHQQQHGQQQEVEVRIVE